MRDERAGEAGATLAERLAHMRVIGAGWCDEATYELLIDVIAAVAERVTYEAWCPACGATLEHTIADDDNPEGLAFRHRDGCAFARLEAHLRGNAGVTP